MFVRTIIPLLVIFFTICNIFCFSVVPDRAAVTHVNSKFVKNVTVNVRRASKRGVYVINVQGITTVPLGNNVTVHVKLYEHSSKFNQYINTFIEFHNKLCDMIHDGQILGVILRRIGVMQCPIEPGLITWNNLTLTKELDFQWPFDAGKAETSVRSESANELMLSVDVIFHIQRKNRKS